MNSKDLISALSSLETDRNISKDVIIDALKEALVKAYRKHSEIPDAQVRVEINDESGEITMFQQYNVVEEPEYDDIEISLEEARSVDQSLNIGDVYEEEVFVDDLGRAAAQVAKNILKQKVREAEKQSIYDEYIDKLYELVLCNIESVEEKFIVVNLGKTLAVMPKAAQIPGEHYYEGQKIKVVITEVNKDTHGAQVLVSRSDPRLVRRLFEIEVPEIYQGIVEIKAIAREAGDRCKMAVYSKNSDIDPIGACIGPRGSRVQAIIEELKGEKIDIFEWSDNIEDLIRNALAPAQIVCVIPSLEKKGLLVVVDDDQLSLAIGKKGKNVRLGVKLTGQHIDIKTRSELEAAGIDYKQLAFEYAVEQERLKREKAAAELERIRQEEAEALARRQEEEQAILAQKEDEIEEEENKAEESVSEIQPEETPVEERKTEEKESVKAEEKKKEAKAEEKPAEPEKPKKTRKPLTARTDYVSKFEEYADAEVINETKSTKSKKKKDDEERKARSADIRKDLDYEIRPEYSEEELAEIEDSQYDEEYWDDDIDYDEYDSYYDED